MALPFSRSSLQQLRRFPLASGSVSPLFSATEFRQRLLAGIAAATRRIYLTALYLQDDEAGHEILEALQTQSVHNPNWTYAFWSTGIGHSAA